jgi:hypothetical protein
VSNRAAGRHPDEPTKKPAHIRRIVVGPSLSYTLCTIELAAPRDIDRRNNA